MVNSKKFIKQVIIISIYCIILGELFLWFAIGLFVSAVPNDRLEKAITFIQKSEYIGMTVDECKELLGEEGKDWPNCTYIGAGSYRHCRDGEYILILYYNDDRKVIYAELEETWY